VQVQQRGRRAWQSENWWELVRVLASRYRSVLAVVQRHSGAGDEEGSVEIEAANFLLVPVSRCMSALGCCFGIGFMRVMLE
jgi:hypothetical protein